MNQTAFHQIAIDSMKRLRRSYLIDHSEAEFRFLLQHIADDFIISELASMRYLRVLTTWQRCLRKISRNKTARSLK